MMVVLQESPVSEIRGAKTVYSLKKPEPSSIFGVAQGMQDKRQRKDKERKTPMRLVMESSIHGGSLCSHPSVFRRRKRGVSSLILDPRTEEHTCCTPVS
jgi:hypothetical protein